MLSVTPQILLDLGADSDPGQFVQVGDEVYFTTASWTEGIKLWHTDGTPAGTMHLADIAADATYASTIHPTEFNGKLIFAADDGSSGLEPWISDGTAAGTMRIKDINPTGSSLNYTDFVGTSDASPLIFPRAPFTEYQGELYFAADNGLLGAELWKTDGTESGTVLVKDINPDGPSLPGGQDLPDGPYSLFDGGFATSGDSLFFAAYTATEGFELWKTDGTEQGTVLVKDIHPGTDVSSIISGFTDIWGPTDVNGTLFFTGDGGESDYELWKSDGTEAGTVLVKDIHPGDNPSYPVLFTPLNDTLLFFAFDGYDDFYGPSFDLWRSDGTEVGTVLVKEYFASNPYNGVSPEPTEIAASNGTLFYSAGNEGDHELWKSDGSEAGTVLVADIRPGSDASFPNYLTPIVGGVAFVANDGVNGTELWVSDGSAEGTSMVTDLRAGSSGSNPKDLAYFDGKLYFSADDGINGRQLWVVDLAIAPVADAGGPYSSDEGSTIVLSALASEKASLFEWDLDNDGLYDDATGETIDFVAPDDGVYPIGLRVDGVSTDTTTVTVNNVAPTASISGLTEIYRGETVTFTLNASDPSSIDQAGLFTFEIDIDGNGTIDVTLNDVPDGATFQHTFSSLGANDIQVKATDKDGATGSFSHLPITVSPHVLRDDGQGNTDLIWGGTPLLDAVYVSGQGPALSLFVQFEGLQLVNRLESFGTAVTGKIILHGYGFADVLVGEFAKGNVLEIHGGGGDDVIVAGFLGDELFGDAGNDVILGGSREIDGNDLILGGEGKDTLFGHYGADTLDGGGGEDLLISDRFAFNDVPQAVQRIANEWRSSRPYAERMSNILGITSTGVNQGSILGANVTVATDGAADLLIGGLGELDWFFYDFFQDLLGDTIEIGEEGTNSNP